MRRTTTTARVSMACATKVCAVLALGLLATGALALDRPLGPRFGNTKFKTTLQDPDGEPDVDTYVSELIAGESLDVSLTAGKGMAVELTVRGPDGADRTPELKVKQAGRKVSFKKLLIDQSGTWSVTARQANDTQGKYSIGFKVKSPKPIKGKKLSGGTNAPDAVHRFQAVNGSHLSLSITSKSDKALVLLVDSSRPGGARIEGLAESMEMKKTKQYVSDFVLTGGDGEYSVTVASTSPTAFYSIQLRVTPPERPGKKGVLTENEPRLMSLTEPTRTASGFALRLEGTGFVATEDADPLVYVGNNVAGVSAVAEDGTWIDVAVPSLSGGLHGVAVRNPDGQAHERSDYVYVVPVPVLVDVKTTTGFPLRKISTLGGDVAVLQGAGLGDHITVDVNGVPVTVTQVIGSTELRVQTPGVVPGSYTFRVTDDFGRSSSTSFVVKFPRRGYGEGDSGRLPTPTAVDDWSAVTAALGDLDGDDDTESLVVAAPIFAAAYGFADIGTRDEHTRVLRLSDTAAISDTTGSKMPAALAAAFPYDTDDWNATAVALGDLDGTGGQELVIGGFADTFEDGSPEATLYGTNYNAAGVRVFSNVAGRFVLDPDVQPESFDRRPPVVAVDENQDEHVLFGTPIVDLSGPQAIAIGDVDGDGDEDVVVARDEAEMRRVRLDVGDVDFGTTPPYVSSADAAAFVEPASEVYGYFAGTAVLENRLDAEGDFAYAPLALPFSIGGGSTGFTGTDSPGLHARDIALVDVDGDDDLDLVVAWDDPTSVSVAGRKEVLDRRFDGDALVYSSAPPMVATRVLLNDGAGHFTDATDSWMPAGAGDEWSQATRVLAVNVVGDDAPDLILGLDASLDAFRGTSLTPLDASFSGSGNEGEIDTGGDTDSYTVTVPDNGRLVVRTRLGTLADSVLRVFGPDSGATLAGEDDDALGKASRVDIAVTPGQYVVEVSGFAGDQSGTYELHVGFLPAGDPSPTHAARALRILENRGADEGFVDVSDDVLPALPGTGDEDFRCGAVAVGDVDRDGRTDIVFATTDAVTGGASGERVSSFRVLLGQADGTWALSTEFVPPVSVDSGEAQDIVIVPTGEQPQPSILLVSKTPPTNSSGGRLTRLWDWNR